MQIEKQLYQKRGRNIQRASLVIVKIRIKTLAYFWLPIWIGCSPQTTEKPALSKWSDSPPTLVKQCQAEGVEELQTICWIQAATQVMKKEENSAAAALLCQNIREELWLDECHFRIAEQSSIVGDWREGIRWCRQAGRFEKDCLKHAYWREPLQDLPALDAPASEIRASFKTLQSDISSLLAGLPPSLKNKGLYNISAQFAHSLVVGSGRARADLAHEPGMFGAMFRTVYGIEAARILAAKRSSKVEIILKNWREKKDIIGKPNRRESFKGRYQHNKPDTRERGAKRLTSFAGYTRLRSDDPEHDLIIAALEGFFIIESTPPAVYEAYIGHPSDEVRWTAKRLFRTTRFR